MSLTRLNDNEPAAKGERLAGMLAEQSKVKTQLESDSSLSAGCEPNTWQGVAAAPIRSPAIERLGATPAGNKYDYVRTGLRIDTRTGVRVKGGSLFRCLCTLCCPLNLFPND